MKRGHEIMRNPILRQLDVGSLGSLWLKGSNWVSWCFGLSLPLHGGVPAAPPTARLAVSGDVQSEKSRDLLPPEDSLHSRLTGS